MLKVNSHTILYLLNHLLSSVLINYEEENKTNRRKMLYESKNAFLQGPLHTARFENS